MNIHSSWIFISDSEWITFGSVKNSIWIQYRVIPSFRPRFAGKCDRQSRVLTQLFAFRLHFAVKPTTNHPRSSCSNSHLRKHSSEIFNGEYEYFLSSTRNRSWTPLLPSRTRSPLSYASFERVLYWDMPPVNMKIFLKLFYLNSHCFRNNEHYFRMFRIINCPHYKIWSTHQDHVNQQILMYSFPKTWVRKNIIFLTNISKRPGDDKLFSMNLNQNENKNKKIEYWVFTFLTSHAVPLKYLKLL